MTDSVNAALSTPSGPILLPSSRLDLDFLNDTGVKVDRQGHLSDWANRPAVEARPIQPLPPQSHKKKKSKKEFTADEEQDLILWCTAAAAQGVLVGSEPFEQLECLRPAHTWQAYESKWRKGHLCRQPRPLLGTDAPFPKLSYPNLECSNMAPSASSVLPSQGLNLSQTAQQMPEKTLLPESPDITLLNSGSSTSTSPPASVQYEGSASGEGLTYSDFRVDIARRFYPHVAVVSEEDFINLLKEPWVIQAYREYATEHLQPLRSQDEAALHEIQSLPRANKDKAPHQWKLTRAIEVVRTRSQRYTGSTRSLDKTLWTADDHDIRFMVSLVHGATQAISLWNTNGQVTIETVCERALWLMLWMRWIHKPVSGTSIKTQRIKIVKEEFLQLLSSLASNTSSTPEDLANDMVESTRSVAAPTLNVTDSMQPRQDSIPLTVPLERTAAEIPPITIQETDDEEEVADYQIESIDYSHQGDVAVDVPGSGSTKHRGWSRSRLAKEKLDVPTYDMPLSKNRNQQRGATWLTEDAYMAYKNHRDLRMSEWGVTPDHQGTCILVQQEWANVNPITVMESFSRQCLDMGEKHRQDLEQTSRLRLNIGDVSVMWARASVWFEVWPTRPRRGIDLDAFFYSDEDGPYVKLQGSHLCHHGLCINPNHLTAESYAENMSRKECAAAARNLRSYGVPVPEVCLKHEEQPCLLQHAALTMHEALQIQFDVLRQARGLPRLSDLTRPSDHPRSFASFEHRLPLSFPASTIFVRPESLVSKPEPRSAALEKYLIRCPFCLGVQQRWAQITAYWSHLKLLHEERSRLERLTEIKRSAKMYTAWLNARSSNSEHNNNPTWIKLQQAMADNFDWDVLEGWRLHMDRHYERWLV